MNWHLIFMFIPSGAWKVFLNLQKIYKISSVETYFMCMGVCLLYVCTPHATQCWRRPGVSALCDRSTECCEPPCGAERHLLEPSRYPQYERIAVQFMPLQGMFTVCNVAFPSRTLLVQSVWIRKGLDPMWARMWKLLEVSSPPQCFNIPHPLRG